MKNQQKGFSLIELLIVVAIILIIAAIAIPNLLGVKMAANEASAVASLRTYNTSIVAYKITYGGAPAKNLAQLGPVASGTAPSSASADLVDSLLGKAAPVKRGYNFSYTPVAATSVTQYTILASPQTSSTGQLYTILASPQTSSTGQRYFLTNESGVIYETSDGKVPSIGAADTTPIG